MASRLHGTLLRASLLLVLLFAAAARREATIEAPLRPATFKDEILSVPGYDGPLPSRQFGGYMHVGGERQLYYYLVSSERSIHDPLVLWLNGGPGCSSFDGFVYEHGPFVFGDGASPLPLRRNPFSWSASAHILYIDSPAGVGLSYSSNPSMEYKTNDTRTAADLDAALRGVVAIHPELATSLFIAGESYAGVFVPVTAQTVLKNNAAGLLPVLPLRGFLVGNGCTDEAFDGNALVPFAAGHAFISQEQHADILAACPERQYWNATGACASSLEVLDAELDGLNIYDVLEPCARDLPALTLGRAWPLRATLPPRGSVVANWASVGVYVPCMDVSAATSWLNDDAVRSAINAAPRSITGNFSLCSDEVEYTHDTGSMVRRSTLLFIKKISVPLHAGAHTRGARRARPARAHLFGHRRQCVSRAPFAPHIDVTPQIFFIFFLVCVPHTGTEAWVRSLGLPVSDPWRPWVVDAGGKAGAQPAGHTIGFDGLRFATVKGAGHTVPQYKPAQALALFTRFIDNTHF